MNVYRKTIAAVLGAAGTWCVATLPDGKVGTMEWVALGIAVATALGVYAVPNDTATDAPAKTTRRRRPRGDAGHVTESVVIGLVVLGVVVTVAIACLLANGDADRHRVQMVRACVAAGNQWVRGDCVRTVGR